MPSPHLSLRWAPLTLALLGTAASARPASPQTAPGPDTPSLSGRRGPLEIRDDHLLAQPRLSLPAISPHPVARGRWALDVSVLWSNSFSWTQDQAGETPADRRFLIDGEAVTLAASLRRGLTRDVDVGVRLPVHHRGGGALDGFIDAWHRLFGLPDAERPRFRRDAFRVEGRTTRGEPFSWSERAGIGLGDLELDVRWRARDGCGDGPSVALVGRLSLPTASAPFDGNGPGAGGQIVLDAPLARRLDLYAGAGVTVQGAGPVGGVEYARTRGHGFVALEWRPGAALSVVAETNVATRLVRSIDSYPGVHWVVNVGGRLDVGSRARIDVGLTENLENQQSTTDLALYFSLGLRP